MPSDIGAMKIEGGPIAIAAGWTNIYTSPTNVDMSTRRGWVNIHLKNTGLTNALTDFRVRRKFHDDLDLQGFLSGTDFTVANAGDSPDLQVSSGSDEANTLAANTEITVQFKLRGAKAFEIDAQSSSGTNAQVFGNFPEE